MKPIQPRSRFRLALINPPAPPQRSSLQQLAYLCDAQLIFTCQSPSQLSVIRLCNLCTFNEAVIFHILHIPFNNGAMWLFVSEGKSLRFQINSWLSVTQSAWTRKAFIPTDVHTVRWELCSMFSMRLCSFYHFFVCFPCSSLEILSPMHENGNRALQTNDDSSSLFLQALHIWSMKNNHNRFCILVDRNCLMNKMSSRKHLNFVFSSVSLRFEDKSETSFQTPQKTIINWINRNVCICYSRQHN